jgi:hypothetical protein
MALNPDQLRTARELWVYTFIIVFAVIGMVAFLKTNPIASFITLLVGVFLGYTTAWGLG